MNCFFSVPYFLSTLLMDQIDNRSHSKDNTYQMIRILSKQKSGLNVCHINAQSIKGKIDEFRYIFEGSDIDVICVTETWLNDSIKDEMVSLKKFKIFRNDRKSLGGGVAIYVKENVCSKSVFMSQKDDKVEHIFVEIGSFGNKMLLGCVYRPNRNINMDSFHTFLESSTVNYEDVIVCGDFNSNILLENNLLNDMSSIGLHPTNTSAPTHFSSTSSSLLDIFFVDDTQKVLLYDQLIASSFSRHDLIFLTYNFETTINKSTSTYYDFKHISPHTLQSELDKVDLSPVFYMPSAEDQLIFLETNVNQIFLNTVPIKTANNKNKSWFNAAIKSAIGKRNDIFKRWKRFKTDALYNEYSIARKEVNRLIRKAKTEYYNRVFSAAIDSKKTWKTLRDIGIGKTQQHTSDIEVDVDKINETFINIPEVTSNDYIYDQNTVFVENDYEFMFACVTQSDVLKTCLSIKSNAIGLDNLHPRFLKLILPKLLPFLTYIFNNIITKSRYPSNWKHAKILPIPKTKGEYRPIAILPYLSKVFEKLIYNQISFHLRENSLLSDRQSGFRAKRSCITALLDVSEELRKKVDAGNIALLVLLDHSKAFDCVNHNILCMKLRNLFNFSHVSIRLIESYLKNRFQSVFANNRLSKPLSVPNGVPQGSILGPLLFTMYINDISDSLQYCDIHLYADDVQIYMSCGLEQIEQCVRNLNQDLQRIHNWASINYLSVNPSKSKCVVITPRHKRLTYEPELVINSDKIEIVPKAKNLGIIFNNTLTWSDHILAATGRTYSLLRTLWYCQYFTPPRIRLLLAKTYVLPTLLYGCELFASTDSASFAKLNGAYNAVARYVYGLRKYDHISTFSKKLYGVTFPNLLKIRSLIFLHKIVYTREPQYLYKSIRFTRSNRSNDIIPVRHKSLMSDWQFFVSSIRLWNLLPSSIQFISNAEHFKKAIFVYFT